MLLNNWAQNAYSSAHETMSSTIKNPQNTQPDGTEIGSLAAEAASKIDDLIRLTETTPKKSPTTSIASIGSDLDPLKSLLKQKQLKSHSIGGSPCNENDNDDGYIQDVDDIDSVIRVTIVSKLPLYLMFQKEWISKLLLVSILFVHPIRVCLNLYRILRHFYALHKLYNCICASISHISTLLEIL